MWERIGAMVFKEMRQMIRDPGTIAMMFFFPIIELVIFGVAIDDDPRHLPLAVEANDNSAITRSIVSGLRTTSYFDLIELTGRAEGKADRGRARAVRPDDPVRFLPPRGAG